MREGVSIPSSATTKTMLLYHTVCPAKYRRKVLTEAVEDTPREACMEINQGFEMRFEEIGADEDHIHFLVQASRSFPRAESRSLKPLHNPCPRPMWFSLNRNTRRETHALNTERLWELR